MESASGDVGGGAVGEDASSGSEDEEEVIEVREVTKEGFDKATSAQFDLLRVLGQGSFGKVRPSVHELRILAWSEILTH